MYATFEEFIDTHTSFGKFGEPSESPKTSSSPGGSSKGKRDDLSAGASRPRPRTGSRHRSRPGPRQVIGGSALELAVPSRDMAAPAPVAAAVEFNMETAPRLGNSKDDMSLVYRRPHHRCRYRRSRRRADVANPLLETISAIQDPCESDDHDFGDPGPHYHRLAGARYSVDADKDSVGYAGSNSIDSGYKSSCPTPEPSPGDALLYDAGGKRGTQKPRIAMGTKVMARHARDLDHLMYLRQSILSAMQRYEQAAGGAGGPGPGFRPRSSSASSPGYRSASPSPGPGPGPGGGGPSSSPLPQRRPPMASCPSSRTHSPCYSSASNGSGKSSPGYHRSRLATAEEDIDSLLYGRAEDMPCSYVSMRSSLARVKKLREKNRGGLTAPESSSSSESSCTSPTGPNSQSGRFSEVAKCMLEIIEDLQNQTQIPGLVPPGSTPLSPPAPAPSAPTPESGPLPNSPLSSCTEATGIWGPEMSPGILLRQGTGPDYHVYEEIMYELTTRPRSDPGPPPLPARPDGIFRSGTTVKKPSPPQSHRPKQRSNLYSLFREPSARRDISQSLEQEFRGAGHPRRIVGPRSHTDQDRVIQSEEEEYGFRVGT
ncbi:uncharacterized protein [Periplaneta americana]